MPKTCGTVQERQRVGHRILKRREELFLSRATLAATIKVSTPAIIHKYETGYSTPNVIIAMRLAKALGTTLDGLFWEKPK